MLSILLSRPKGSLGPQPGMLPLCIDKKLSWESSKFQTNYEPPESEPRATVSSASELVSAKSLQRWVFSISHFYSSSFLPWDPLPHSPPLAALSPPPLSPLEHSCFPLLPFLLLVLRNTSPPLPIPFFGQGMPCCNRNGFKRGRWLQLGKTKDSRGELNALDKFGKHLTGGNKNTLFFYLHIF